MNEIIKALECCSHRGKGCDDCPVNYKITEFCFEAVMSDALDLINSQKAEIEELKADKIIAETHEKAAKDLLKDNVRHKSTVKSEAIKEFVEGLKYKADKTRIKNIETERIVFYMDEFKLNDLVKEMTEIQESEEN